MAKEKVKSKVKERRSERIMINVTPSCLERIDEMAAKLHMTRSKFLDILIVFAIEDNELMVDFLSVTALPVCELVKRFRESGMGSKKAALA